MNAPQNPPSPAAPPICILGVPFDYVTTTQSLGLIEQMIASGRPHYGATANVDFVVQAREDLELRRILLDAHLVMCDGMPLVWASRKLGNPLPERVTGSDMVPRLLGEAERKGWRVFFLGGQPSSLAAAAEKTRAKHPRLQLVGAYSPPFKPLMEMDNDDLARRIREARPDVLLVAFGCPKQEKWINMNYRALGVPFCVGVGATLDFLAGSVSRAPRWMQRCGLEWLFRLAQEPRRLFHRYFTDFWVFGRAILSQCRSLRPRRGGEVAAPVLHAPDASGATRLLELPARFDIETARRHGAVLEQGLSGGQSLLLGLSAIKVIDSTGVALLARWQTRLRAGGRSLVLVAPSAPVLAALDLMRFREFFSVAPDADAARALAAKLLAEENVVAPAAPAGLAAEMQWQGELTAVNAEAVWAQTEAALNAIPAGGTLKVSLASLRFLDSSGIGIMLRASKAGRQRGITVLFCEPPPAVRSVIKLVRMEKILFGENA